MKHFSAQEFFSNTGRFCRIEYFLYTVTAYIPLYFYLIVIHVYELLNKPWVEGTAVVLFIIGFVSHSMSIVKRFHDMDLSGKYLLFLLFVPFYDVYLFIKLLIFPGTKGTNKYGPQDLEYDNFVEEQNESV